LEFFSADLSRDELATEGVVTDAVDYTESLVREILSASDDTAMIMLSTWAVPHPYINGAEKHNIVAEYYVGGLRSFGMETDEQAGCDAALIPGFSLQVLHAEPGPALRAFQPGGLWSSEPGGSSLHGSIGWVLFRHSRSDSPVETLPVIYHLETVLCQMETELRDPPRVQGSRFRSEYDPYRVPAVRLRQGLRDAPFAESRALCRSANIRKPDGSWGLTPSFNQGFRQLEMYDKSWWA
jgi:hypothetical protein